MLGRIYFIFVCVCVGKRDYEQIFFSFFTEKFLVKIDCEVEKVKKDDGKTLAFIKDFTFVAEPLNKINYDFRNLFNGREDLGK